MTDWAELKKLSITSCVSPLCPPSWVGLIVELTCSCFKHWNYTRLLTLACSAENFWPERPTFSAWINFRFSSVPFSNCWSWQHCSLKWSQSFFSNTLKVKANSPQRKGDIRKEFFIKLSLVLVTWLTLRIYLEKKSNIRADIKLQQLFKRSFSLLWIRQKEHPDKKCRQRLFNYMGLYNECN